MKKSERESAIFFLVYVFWGFLTLGLLTDWQGYLQQEAGYILGAGGLFSGRPFTHSFAFASGPGILFVYALIQKIGASWLSGRFVLLLASAFLVFQMDRVAEEWCFSRAQRWLLRILMVLWGFSLWNLPSEHLMALAIILFAYRAFRHKPSFASFMAIAFFFHPGIALWGFGAALFLKALKKNWRIFSFDLCIFSSSIFFPAALFYSKISPTDAEIFFGGIWHSLSKIPQAPIPIGALAAPMVFFGIWLLSLFFVQRVRGFESKGTEKVMRRSMPAAASGDQKFMRIIQLFVLFYAGLSVYRYGQDYFIGLVFLFSLLVWVGFFLIGFLEKIDTKKINFIVFLLAISLASFDGEGVQHLLFIFPSVAFLLLFNLDFLCRKYKKIPPAWAHLPVILLIFSGIFFQARNLMLWQVGSRDSSDRISFGLVHLLNEEMHQVVSELKNLGVRPGENVDIYPFAAAFYLISGFDFLSQKPDELGIGKYFVLRKGKESLERDKVLMKLKNEYKVIKTFPQHFSVWQKKL